MRFTSFFRCACLALVLVLPACETGTGPRIPSGPTFLHLESTAGDPVGQGREYDYTQATATFSLNVQGSHLWIDVHGDEPWHGDLATGGSRLTKGEYTDASVWSLDGRNCYPLSTWMWVDSVMYDGSTLTGIDLRTVQECANATGELRARLHWRADDPTTPPGPIMPVPDTLWSPPPGATPDSGDYIYLQSDPGDIILNGVTHLFLPAEGAIDAYTSGDQLFAGQEFNSAGGWYGGHGEFRTMDTLRRMAPGYYPGAQASMSHNPTRGSFDWSGEGVFCGHLDGWFAIDDIQFADTTLTGVTLRFVQHCEGNAAALRGKVHWSK